MEKVEMRFSFTFLFDIFLTDVVGFCSLLLER